MKKQRFILDRIEENIAVLEYENGITVSVNFSLLPENSSAGDCFVLSENGYIFDEKYTKSRRRKISEIKNRLTGNNK